MDLSKYVREGLLESVLNSDERLVEAKSASEWWDTIDKKARGKVLLILGMNKGKDKKPFAKLDSDERGEIRAYFSKHKGKVESVDFDWDAVPEGRLVKVYSSRVSNLGGFLPPGITSTKDATEAFEYAYENRGDVVLHQGSTGSKYYTRIGDDIVRVRPGKFDRKSGVQEFRI